MKKLFILLILTGFTTLFAQEKKEPTAEEKAWMEYMTPSWGHELLKESVGKWKTTAKYWMKPGDEPQIVEGEASYEMILGGRYLKSNHKSPSFFNIPMEGFSIEGFDNAKQQFFSVWVDNMGTGLALSYGKYDKEKKEMVQEGSMTDPVTGKDMKYKMVSRYIDKDNMVLIMSMPMGDEEFVMMEMKYTRIK